MTVAVAEGRPGSAKTFWRGTHRTVVPEATLARLTPLLDAMGITRVGMITGLNSIGLPVAQATRPNSRAVAVSLGKGVTVAAAKVSAIMEAAETYHAETVAGPLPGRRRAISKARSIRAVCRRVPPPTRPSVSTPPVACGSPASTS